MKHLLARIFRIAPLAAAWGFCVISLPAAAYDWLQFGGSPAHSGNNVLEKGINKSNVNTLTQKFQANLPAGVDGTPVLLRNVLNNGVYRDLLFVTTTNGYIVAVDAQTGTVAWSKQFGPGTCKINNGGSTCYTTSSPAVDPNGSYVYSYGLDGYVHKLAVGDGTEVLTGGWPQLATAKGFDEKGSSALGFATTQGTTYLYMTHGGYPGDNGDYQGHVTAINLANGTQKVFNAACSSTAQHLQHLGGGGSPICMTKQNAIWARPGVIFDAGTNRLFAATGNAFTAGKGRFDGALNWSESVLAINPDGSGTSTGPIDSYTPMNWSGLDDGDADIGSTTVQHLAVQAGKDGMLRLINLADMSGHGGPGHTGGEIGSIINVPQGANVVLTQPAVWVNPVDNATWVFVANGSGISGLKLQIDAGGNPSLASQWQTGAGGTSPVVANNVLYYAAGSSVKGLDPTTGATLWTSSGIGGMHWGSPIVANGKVYVADQSSHLTAFAPAYIPTPYDLNANGMTDLLWNSSAGGQTASWLMNGLSATSMVALMTDPNWQVVASGDFNGDNKADLVWRNAATGQVAIWLMNGNTVTSSAIVFADPNWTITGTGDFNGDGKTDLLWRNSVTGQTAIWLMNGLSALAMGVIYGDINWHVAFVGDFNGDGKSDLLWRNNATGQTAIWLMDGMTPTATAIIYSDPTWSVVATGDFNGDGKTDLLWRKLNTGQTAMWLMNGTAPFVTTLLPFDPNATLVATGDFNGDGMTDVVWRNATTGQVAAWLMNGTAATSTAIIFADPNWTVINPSQ